VVNILPSEGSNFFVSVHLTDVMNVRSMERFYFVWQWLHYLDLKHRQELLFLPHQRFLLRGTYKIDRVYSKVQPGTASFICIILCKLMLYNKQTISNSSLFDVHSYILVVAATVGMMYNRTSRFCA